MKKVDYIIVGAGYAGLFFAHQLHQDGKTFVIFSGKEKGASHVSAGMVNPAVLKKFTTFWLAQEQLDFLQKTLAEIQNYTGVNYFIPEPVHRIFHDEQERGLWLKKSDSDGLKDFLSKDFTQFPIILNPFSTGEVMQSGRLNVPEFFAGVTGYFKKSGNLSEDHFAYEELDTSEKQYREYRYQNIVFCEGMNVTANPFFRHIELQPNKGHHLTVKLSKKPAGKTFKKKHFLFPLNANEHYYGGTYDRDRTDHHIDENAVAQLKNGLAEFYPFPFQTLAVEYGFRPTVKDRRPIIGRHPIEEDLYVFNGLGARGVLNGCFFAQSLFQLIENGVPLPPEVDISRFDTDHEMG